MSRIKTKQETFMVFEKFPNKPPKEKYIIVINRFIFSKSFTFIVTTNFNFERFFQNLSIHHKG